MLSCFQTSPSRHLPSASIDASCEPVTGDVMDRHFPTFMQLCGYRAYRGFDAVFPGMNPAHIRQRHHQSDGAVPTHAQVADVVEEDNARRARPVDRFAEQSSNNDIRSSRFIHYGRPNVIIAIPKAHTAIG